MSGIGSGEALPSWEQLLSGSRPMSRRLGTTPRHARSWPQQTLRDDVMSWPEAAAWSTLAVACALAARRCAWALLS
jgi:hypothetical protein